jgi:hypothetical protein
LEQRPGRGCAVAHPGRSDQQPQRDGSDRQRSADRGAAGGLAWIYILLRYATGHRAPGSRGLFPADTAIGRKVHYPSLIGVVVAWVIGLFTVVGYLLALYMSYRYLTGKRANSLADRLAQLDQACASGLITAEEYQAKRATMIGSL